MKARRINEMNEAIFVLKHFVNLSARLLPFLNNLSKKESPTIDDLNDSKKIIAVYNNYSFDAKASQVLINSSVLEKIQQAFHAIVHACKDDRREADLLLSDFLNEHRRLQEMWKRVDAN